MSNKQRDVIREYCTLKRWPSIRAMAEDTGIHRSRLFRIVKGAEMKLGEYEIFQSKIFHMKKYLRRRKKNFKEELKDLVHLFMEHPLKEVPNASLRVRKIWMTFTEERVLASRIAEVESFINSVDKQKRELICLEPKHVSLKPEKQLVVFWGSTEYYH